ncbi:MAG: transposase [Candidatus Kapaibacterium sp.]|nr:MAG: transposase [Candidatus Kapabacteria bacterium]
MKSGRRTFSAAYKTHIVLESIGSPSSQTKICRRELLSLETLKQWKEQFLSNAVAAFGGSRAQQEHEESIARLERLVGQLTIENSILKKFRPFRPQ